jgi:hypothetical protein
MIGSEMTYGDVIDPDKLGIIKRQNISSPNVLGVEVRDGDVLDDNVSGTAANP